MGASVEGLPVLERLILHLHHVDPVGRGSSPEAQTQTGISTAIGIQRKHIPRAIRRLVEEGWILLVLKHVDGHRQRLRVHVLSPTGQEEVKRLRTTLQERIITTHHGREMVLDLIDAGRIDELNASSPREKSKVEGATNPQLLQLAAHLLCCTTDELLLLIDQAQTFSRDEQATLDGSEAVFLSCFETALTDGVITDDEEAMLTTLREELGPFRSSLNAHVATLLHDMMR